MLALTSPGGCQPPDESPRCTRAPAYCADETSKRLPHCVLGGGSKNMLVIADDVDVAMRRAAFT